MIRICLMVGALWPKRNIFFLYLLWSALIPVSITESGYVFVYMLFCPQIWIIWDLRQRLLQTFHASFYTSQTFYRNQTKLLHAFYPFVIYFANIFLFRLTMTFFIVYWGSAICDSTNLFIVFTPNYFNRFPIDRSLAFRDLLFGLDFIRAVIPR